jgi:N-acetyl-gamma-glutamylphosphate reductase
MGKMSAKALRGMLAEYYHGQRFVDVKPYESDAWLEEGFFDPTACNNTNRLEILSSATTRRFCWSPGSITSAKVPAGRRFSA